MDICRCQSGSRTNTVRPGLILKQCGRSIARPASPSESAKHFHTVGNSVGGGVKVLLRYFLTRK